MHGAIAYRLRVLYFFAMFCKCPRDICRLLSMLADRKNEHAFTCIKKKSKTVREQPSRICKNSNSELNCEPAIGQHRTTNPKCAKTYTDDKFWMKPAFVYTKRVLSSHCRGSIRNILSHAAISGNIFQLAFWSLSDVSYEEEC